MFAQAQTGHKVHYAVSSKPLFEESRVWDAILQLVFPLESGKMTIALRRITSLRRGMLFAGNMLTTIELSVNSSTPGIQVEELWWSILVLKKKAQWRKQDNISQFKNTTQSIYYTDVRTTVWSSKKHTQSKYG